MDWSKKEKQTLRKLVDIAYKRELSQALCELENKFKDWHDGQISCFELSDLIHNFHDGINRELWAHYMRVNPFITVPGAIAQGILKKEEIPSGILNKFKDAVAMYEKTINENSNSSPQ